MKRNDDDNSGNNENIETGVLCESPDCHCKMCLISTRFTDRCFLETISYVCSPFILHHATGTPYTQNRRWKKNSLNAILSAKYHRNLIVLRVRNFISSLSLYIVRVFSLQISISPKWCVYMFVCLYYIWNSMPTHFFSVCNFSRIYRSFINSNRFLWIHDFWLLFNKSHSIHTQSFSRARMLFVCYAIYIIPSNAKCFSSDAVCVCSIFILDHR